ncbi:MAG: hypothetical protein QOG66_1763, partial [Methylobacteriaceae bacterium]|nr:hypothetical protein [Methylobacteriaceae bacterium]
QPGKFRVRDGEGGGTSADAPTQQENQEG